MTFKLAVDPDTFDSDRLQGHGEVIYRVPVGFDATTRLTYSVVVAIARLPGYGDDSGFELVFSIIETSEDQTHLKDFWDGSETKKIITRSADRRKIRQVVKAVVGLIIEDFRPPYVVMFTHSADLPEPALRKYLEIASIFRQNNYEVIRQPIHHGRTTWTMERK